MRQQNDELESHMNNTGIVVVQCAGRSHALVLDPIIKYGDGDRFVKYSSHYS